MPQILIATDASEDGARTVVYRERIAPSDLESDHFSGQLVERVGWALLDADQIEQGTGPDLEQGAGSEHSADPDQSP
jgi:hypothetical protein